MVSNRTSYCNGADAHLQPLSLDIRAEDSAGLPQSQPGDTSNMLILHPLRVT
jgi:hypothetical protein